MTTSELGFLVDLLLNHKLPPATKSLVASRIKEVEEGLSAVGITGRLASPLPKLVPQQATSTQAILAKHTDLNQGGAIAVAEATEPVPNLAQTAAAQAALASRERAMSGRTELDRNTGRPRKF